MEKGFGERQSSHDEEYEVTTTTVGGDDAIQTIGLFGLDGPTGQNFCKLALEAGYYVKALSSSQQQEDNKAASKQGWRNYAHLTIYDGTIQQDDVVSEVIHGSTFVVCMQGDVQPKNKDYKPLTLALFVKKIYPLMRESTTRLFVYQATSFCCDLSGGTPILSKVAKRILSQNKQTEDHNAVIQYMAESTGDWFSILVTRPSPYLKSGRSKKRLAASKSQPSPVPVTYYDLAEFTLNALKDESLYNKAPYVVGDGFR